MTQLGKPELPQQSGKTGNSEWRNLYYFPTSDFKLYTQDGKVAYIGIGAGTSNTAKCVTSKGVRIGNRISGKAKKEFGEPDGRLDKGVLAWWIYNKRGIGLILNPQGDVLGVEIFAPGTYCSVSQAANALGWPFNSCADFKPPFSLR